MSPTASWGWSPRSAVTSCAAARLPPPTSKKSASFALHCDAEHVLPVLREPAERVVEPGGFLRIPAARQRPRQRVAIDLARRPHRDLVADPEDRHRAAGQARAQGAGRARPGRGRRPPGTPRATAGPTRWSAPPMQPRQPLAAPTARRRAHRARRAVPPTFTWSSARPTKRSPGGVVHDQVAASVRPLPAQRGQGSEAFGVERRVEVPGEPDPADDQLPSLARGTGSPASSTTARSHPASGRPIRTGSPARSRAPHATTVVSVGP